MLCFFLLIWFIQVPQETYSVFQHLPSVCLIMFIIRINEGKVPYSPENSTKGILKVVWQQGLHSWDPWALAGSRLIGSLSRCGFLVPVCLGLGVTGSSQVGVQVRLMGPEPSLSRACAARLACFIIVFIYLFIFNRTSLSLTQRGLFWLHPACVFSHWLQLLVVL